MQILMPQLGETVTEGTITAWRRAEGESVAADEVLFELETDKVSTEVPAPSAGVLRRILVAAGDTVAVGTPLAELDIPGEGTHDGSNGAGTSQGVATAFPNAKGSSTGLLLEADRAMYDAKHMGRARISTAERRRR